MTWAGCRERDAGGAWVLGCPGQDVGGRSPLSRAARGSQARCAIQIAPKNGPASVLITVPDLGYTLAPKWIPGASDGGGDPNMLMWPLASLVLFNERATLPPPTLSPVRQAALAPDDHLFCMNSMYFGVAALEESADLSPAWRAVGRHMHFTPKILELAAVYTRRTLGVQPYEPIPPVRVTSFIAPLRTSCCLWSTSPCTSGAATLSSGATLSTPSRARNALPHSRSSRGASRR
jgi:hypothetical protein